MSKETTRWRAGIALAAGAALITASVVVWRGLGPQVVVVAVERREIVQTVIVSGRVLPLSRVNVGSLVAGVVTQVAVQEGSHVRPGDLLVQLEDSESKAALRLAKAGLRQALAKLSQLRHITGPVASETHKQADANLALAKRSYQRQIELLQGAGAVPSQVDEAKRALDVAQSQYNSTEQQAIGSGPHGAERAVSRAGHAQAIATVGQAKVRVAESHITAAVAGVVLLRSVEPGDLVQPGRTMLVLTRDGQTLLSVQPDEKNLAQLRLGQSALAAAEAFPMQPFAATVSYLAPSIDPQRGTVEVRLAVPAPPAFLRPDMTVSVNIEVGRHPAALVVPNDAVQDARSAQPWVLLIKDPRNDRYIERRPVELGLRGEGLVQILRGLSGHESVVLPGSTKLTPGQRVRIRASPPPALPPLQRG